MKLSRKKQKQALPNRRSHNNVNQKSATPEIKNNSFRRNATLTGSSSNDIRSSNETHASLMSPRAHIHHLQKKRRHLFLRLIVAIILLLSMYLIVSQLVASVSVRLDPDNGKISAGIEEEYQIRVEEYFSNQPVQRLYPLLDSDSLLAFVQSKYPEIQNISLNLTSDFGKAQATLTLRPPVVRWNLDGKNEYVDSQGTVFNNNGYGTPSVEIIDKNGTTISNKNIVASHRFLAFVGRIVGEMKDRNYTVTKATIPTLTTRQVAVTVKGVPYRFKMTIDRPVGEQVEDATRVIRYLKRKSITPKYVDVRVNGEAFYK